MSGSRDSSSLIPLPASRIRGAVCEARLWEVSDDMTTIQTTDRVVIKISLQRANYEKLDALARLDDMPVAIAVRAIVQQYLATHDP